MLNTAVAEKVSTNERIVAEIEKLKALETDDVRVVHSTTVTQTEQEGFGEAAATRHAERVLEGAGGAVQGQLQAAAERAAGAA